MASLTAAKKEFWGDLQVSLHTDNSALYLANARFSDIVSTNGRKFHRPLMSIANVGTYTPYSDITYTQKNAEDQYMEVDTPVYSAEEIDDTDETQSAYDLTGHSVDTVRKGLANRFEQIYLSKITDAFHTTTSVTLDPSNVADIFEEANGKLGAFDVPLDTSLRAAVFGPRAIETMRRARMERETPLGDSVLGNGVIGPWRGYTIVQNNNLPWSASLNLATQPTDGDTVTIAGQVFTFKTTLGTTAGQVLIGADATAARNNLKAAVEGGSGAGTTYIDLTNIQNFIVRKKRYVKCTNASSMAFTGFGDIAVSETLTAAADVWSAQTIYGAFMLRGSIDAVMQLNKIEVTRKEKGFAGLVKGLINVGAKVFTDGSYTLVKVPLSAANYK